MTTGKEVPIFTFGKPDTKKCRGQQEKFFE
jgi:hypothetical protein